MTRKIILFFDTCAFHPPTESEKAAVEQIMKMEKAKLVRIDITHAGNSELLRGPKGAETLGRLSTLEVGLNFEEQSLKNKIREILFPGKKSLTQGDEKDVVHLFEAQKYGCDYFVTFDCKHILSKSVSIEHEIGLRVVSPSECLKLISQKLLK